MRLVGLPITQLQQQKQQIAPLKSDNIPRGQLNYRQTVSDIKSQEFLMTWLPQVFVFPSLLHI